MKFIYTLIILVCLLPDYAFSQTDSTIVYKGERVKVDGKTMISHLVKAKETLYSLSKIYGVKIDDIVAANPEIVNGLKAGQMILIPCKEEKEKEKEQKVKFWEKIFCNKNREKRKEKEDDSRNLKKQKSEKVDTKIDSRGLFMGKVDDTLNVKDSEEIINEDNIGSYGIATIGIVLPINSSNIASINSNYMDFYSGALLAAKDCKESDFDIKINLYDQNDFNSISDIAENNGFSENDILIGPVKKNDIIQLLPYSIDNNIPLISPMDQTAEIFIDESDSFIQVPISNKYQTKNLVDVLAEEYKNDEVANIIVIYEKNGSETNLVNEVISAIEERGVSYKSISYSILEGRGITTSINSLMRGNGEKNIVIVPSTKEAFVSDVVRNLALCYNNEKVISLYGFPKWKNFENIDIDLFHKLNLHLSLPYFVDYASKTVKDFLMTYRALFKTEPSPYSFQGYDITKYFLSVLKSKSVRSMMKNLPKAELMQINFNFIRNNSDVGYENIATKNVVYNSDYTISVIDNTF